MEVSREPPPLMVVEVLSLLDFLQWVGQKLNRSPSTMKQGHALSFADPHQHYPLGGGGSGGGGGVGVQT